MARTTDEIAQFYTSDAYLKQHPQVHEEDSPWKISKLLPFIDSFASQLPQREIVILDVGGGAGLILKAIAAYLEEAHGKRVSKYCLDLSPAILERQRQTNPDAKKTLVADIAATALGDKEVDLALMIDVLEHVSDPDKTLREIARIARYALFKVPLEDTWYYRGMDILTCGRFRERIIASIGHVNVYSDRSLRRQLEQTCGTIVQADFTEVYQYLLGTKLSLVNRLLQKLGQRISRISPRLAARILHDYLIILVHCGEHGSRSSSV